jgi:uncharacterized membrane protein
VNGLPWHPAVVHLPIGLGMVTPLFALVIALAMRRGALARRAWTVVVALQALVLVGGLIAMKTGENEHDRVAEIVEHHFIEEHEERGELFVWLAGAALTVGLGAWALPAGALATAATAGAVLLSAVAAGAVMSAAHLGGELVYQHGAATAYVDDAGEGGGEPHEDHDHDHGHDHQHD